jgi:hypothetical protein
VPVFISEGAVRRQPRAPSWQPVGYAKVTVIVPEDCAKGLLQFVGELCGGHFPAGSTWGTAPQAVRARW